MLQTKTDPSSKILLFSVIVPVYKVEKYLNECVDSILNQTYENIEVILVDDGSPDRCPLICDEYAAKDKRVSVIHKQNGGLSDARNAGIRTATGDYLIFVDSDDMLAQSDVIHNLVGFFELTKADIVHCLNVTRFNENGFLAKKVDLTDEYSMLSPVEWLSIIVQNRFCYAAWTFVVRRKFILEHSLFFKEKLIYEDMEWVPRLLFAQPDLKLNIFTKPFYIYRENQDSLTSRFTQTHFDSMHYILLWITKNIQQNQNIQFMKLWFNINLYSLVLYFENDCLSASDFYKSNFPLVQKLFCNNQKILTFRNRILFIFIRLNPKPFFILRKWVKKMMGRG